jgi:hypothetical protein
VSEDDVYRVMLVRIDGREVNGFFLYRGERPGLGQEIEAENELNPDDRRRARVTGMTADRESVVQGSLIHATELEPRFGVPDRLDPVRFDVGGRQVEMPIQVAEELKARAVKAPSTQSIAAKLVGAGVSGPVEVLDAGEMLALIELLEHWTRNAGDALPESVRELRGAARDALHNRRRGA